MVDYTTDAVTGEIKPIRKVTTAWLLRNDRHRYAVGHVTTANKIRSNGQGKRQALVALVEAYLEKNGETGQAEVLAAIGVTSNKWKSAHRLFPGNVAKRKAEGVRGNKHLLFLREK